MAKVFLHIGAHKTGTSYLQHLFYLNHARLARAGIHYPLIGPNDAHHALAAAWIDMPDLPQRFFGKGGPDKLWNDLIARYARAPGTVFLSAENLSRQSPETVDFADLARRLAPFDEVRVIYTLRQQAELVQSLWLQAAKSGRVLALRPYLARAWEESLGGGIGIDHEALYDALLAGFSPDQIVLLDYAAIRAARGGIAQVFLDLMESGLSAADLAAPPEAKANISPDPLSFYLSSQITGGSLPPNALVAAVTDILRTDPPRRTSLLSQAEHTRFHRQFSPGNARLVERVQPWQQGFAFADPEPSADLFYRNNVAEWKWLQIAAMLYRDAPQASVGERVLRGLSRLRSRR
jgi:hypothetical protein